MILLKRDEIIAELVPNNNGAILQGPIYFDYGCNIYFGKRCYANFNFTVLDSSPVKISDDVFFGPNVTLVTPVHPLVPSERNMYQGKNGMLTDLEYSSLLILDLIAG